MSRQRLIAPLAGLLLVAMHLPAQNVLPMSDHREVSEIIVRQLKAMGMHNVIGVGLFSYGGGRNGLRVQYYNDPKIPCADLETMARDLAKATHEMAEAVYGVRWPYLPSVTITAKSRRLYPNCKETATRRPTGDSDAARQARADYRIEQYRKANTAKDSNSMSWAGAALLIMFFGAIVLWIGWMATRNRGESDLKSDL